MKPGITVIMTRARLSVSPVVDHGVVVDTVLIALTLNLAPFKTITSAILVVCALNMGLRNSETP